MKVTNALRAAIRRQPEFESLWQRLLKIAGTEVKPAPGDYDPAIDELLKNGREMPLDVSMWVMEPEHCHVNVARLWQQRTGGLLAMCVGYALDMNGTVWRQHWWGLTAQGSVVETTVARSRYFGIDFTGVAADGVAAGILHEFHPKQERKS